MEKFRIVIILSLVLIVCSAKPSSAQRKYVIYLKDKANSGYSLSNPLSMISQRALDRRTRQGIAMDSSDIPVNSNYITQVQNTGALVIRKLKWFNALVVDCDSITLNQILSLPFVLNDKRIYKLRQPDLEFEEVPIENIEGSNAKMPFNYGASENQIKMLGADVMHDDGYNGSGMWIGVFDSGFRNSDTISAFDHLRLNNRIIGTFDIVEGDQNVYDEHTHGTSVLSCMAAFSPGQIIGTAFGASYVLFRTEDVFSETQMEEINWLVAAEMADSLGVDVINTSLSYSTMDNSQFSHTYSDMDGNTTIISKAATFASRKGILCINSAGNDGNNSWYYIAAPADADSIITVGAVAPDSVLAIFSSHGPTFDGRIKPNVVAQGQSTAVISSGSGTVVNSSGTSFSGPLIAGFAASLWSAYPNKTNMEMINLIQMASDRFANPNNDYGYGIPNYEKAKFLSSLGDFEASDSDYRFFPNPVVSNSLLNLQVSPRIVGKKLTLEVYNSIGSKIDLIEINSSELVNSIRMDDILSSSDMLYIRVSSDIESSVFKIIKVQ